MRIPTIEEGRQLFNVLTDIQMEARIAAAGAVAGDTRFASPPLDDLRCLLHEAGSIEEIGKHLLSLCIMSISSVRMQIHAQKWRFRPDYHVDRMLKKWDWVTAERRHYPSLHHVPYVVLGDIQWPEPLSHLPAKIWLTHGEIGEQVDLGKFGNDAIAAAFHARHAITPVSYEATFPWSENRDIPD